MAKPRHSSFASPAQLCGRGTWVVAKAGLEGFLYAAVFAGVERQDGDATAGIEARRKIAEETFEGGEFVVHRDTERLKDAANGVVAFFIRGRSQEGAVDCVGQRRRGGKRLAREKICQNTGMWFVGVFLQENGKVVGADLFQ